jgi:polyphosphate glucokinase
MTSSDPARSNGRPATLRRRRGKVLVVDVGGTHVKMLVEGAKTPRKFPSGSTMTPKAMVACIKRMAADWKYVAVSLGYPGPVIHGRILHEPHNLAPGWVGFDFEKAFGCPVAVINDATMQALGSYRGGRMLFLGLGTGLGSAMIIDGIPESMELAHMQYRKGTYEDYVGLRGLERFGKKKWRKYVFDVVARIAAALEPDDIVLGGGNVKKLKTLPKGCRRGANENAFVGGFLLWARRSPESLVRAVSRRRRNRFRAGPVSIRRVTSATSEKRVR